MTGTLSRVCKFSLVFVNSLRATIYWKLEVVGSERLGVVGREWLGVVGSERLGVVESDSDLSLDKGELKQATTGNTNQPL